MSTLPPPPRADGLLRWLESAPGYLGRAASRERRLRGKARNQAAFDAALARLGPGDICHDLGANVGEVTRRMAATGARVHAWEPDPDTFEKLKAALGDLPNVTLHRAAVGAEDGTVTLRRMIPRRGSRLDPSLGSSVVMENPQMSREDCVEVEQVAFRRVLETGGGHAALIKMDVEGAEVPILRALVADGPEAARFDAMFVETHEWQEPRLHPEIVALRRALAAPGWPAINLYWH